MPKPRVPSSDIGSVAAELAVTLPMLYRALDRRVSENFPHPEPTKAQLALLWLVGERDGITVREAADALMMKPNNVSALVSQLAAAELLRREQDGGDKRIAHLHLTAEAERRVDSVVNLTGGFLAEGLQTLTDGELAAIGSALIALRSLTRSLRPIL